MNSIKYMCQWFCPIRPIHRIRYLDAFILKMKTRMMKLKSTLRSALIIKQVSFEWFTLPAIKVKFDVPINKWAFLISSIVQMSMSEIRLWIVSGRWLESQIDDHCWHICLLPKSSTNKAVVRMNNLSFFLFMVLNRQIDMIFIKAKPFIWVILNGPYILY